MPQLDLVTFFTQFLWAILSFFLFYFFVNKLILPELTRVLKYRSKASAVSNSAETGASSQAREENSLSLPYTSEKSGSSTLYNHAGHNSARVLMQARQRKDTFLGKVLSGKGIDRKEFAKSTISEQEGGQGHLSEYPSAIKTKNKSHAVKTTKKSQEKASLSKDLKSTHHKPKESQSLKNIDISKGSKKKKRIPRDSE